MKFLKMIHFLMLFFCTYGSKDYFKLLFCNLFMLVVIKTCLLWFKPWSRAAIQYSDDYLSYWIKKVKTFFSLKPILRATWKPHKMTCCSHTFIRAWRNWFGFMLLKLWNNSDLLLRTVDVAAVRSSCCGTLTHFSIKHSWLIFIIFNAHHLYLWFHLVCYE